MKHSACMKLLSDLIDGETLTITNLTTNARMWSALHGERPSFYGLNMGLCLPFAVGVALALEFGELISQQGRFFPVQGPGVFHNGGPDSLAGDGSVCHAVQELAADQDLERGPLPSARGVDISDPRVVLREHG